MAAKGIVRVNFGDIMQAIEDKLVDAGVVMLASQVMWTCRAQPIHLQAPFDIVIRVQGATVRHRDGGRYDPILSRMLYVWVRALALQDVGGTDKEMLLAHLIKEDLIANALHNFLPTNAAGQGLTPETIKLAHSLEPDRIESAHPYGRSALTFEVLYEPLVTASNEA